MPSRFSREILAVACAVLGCFGARCACAASCTTQAQMSAAQRDALANSARTLLVYMQSGNAQALQQSTIPSLAANFSGISGSVDRLRPLIQTATITVDDLYVLDASDNPAQASSTDFYCGSPVVSLHFDSLPRGTYALAILHATGVPHPQEFSLILSKSSDGRWLLGGFFTKPMMSAGHDGLWYWRNARDYAQTKKAWAAWLYYQKASSLLDPLNFLSSPNLQRLHQEADQIRPANFPGARPMTLTVQGASYSVNAVGTTTTFGPLDLDVRYVPDAEEAEQLSNPPMARKQVTEIMAALVEMHPGLRQAFHGIWVHAQRGQDSLFALELPMEAITSTPPPPAAESTPASH
jgi:hypothetical protein